MVRFYIANIIAKTVYRCMRILGKNGTQLPGKVAVKLCPEYLKFVKRPKHFIAVTGTNGKTTSNNLIIDSLKSIGIDCVNNAYGSNTKDGVIAALVRGTNIFGKVKSDYLVLEVDERSSIHIINRIIPDYLLITNLFRDSSQRNAHTDFIKYILEKAISKDTKLIVNCDDCISSYIAKDNERIGYGVKKLSFEYQNINSNVNDLSICPNCSTPLVADFIRHHHIGQQHCENCGFKNIEPKFQTIDVSDDKLKLKVDNEVYEFNLIEKNITNITNQTGVIAALSCLGIEMNKIIEAMSNIKVVNTRYDVFTKKGKTVRFSLAKGKNPIATSRVLDYAIRSEKNKAVILMNMIYPHMINEGGDELKNDYSENVGWLYEIDFEYLRDEKVKQILVCGGKRYLDYRNRLLLAGIDKDKIIAINDSLKSAELINFEEVEEVWILFDDFYYNYALNIRDKIFKRLDYEN